MIRLIFGLVFLALPFLELALLIKAGQLMGFWATFGIVVAAGVLGTLIWAQQGMSVARKAQQAVAQGKPPVGPVLDGAFLLLAGALLITPGFLTDVLALLLLVPPIRHKVSRWTMRRIAERAHVQVRTFEARTGDAPSRDGASGGGPVIEGEYRRLGERSTPSDRRREEDRP